MSFCGEMSHHRGHGKHGEDQKRSNNGLLDVTDQICPTAGCDQAVVTDALRAMSFSSQAAATRYAREHGLPHWRNVVITFPPEMAAGEQDSYWLAIVEIFR